MESAQSLTNKKVLVTGGAGFIGSNLCENLLHHNNQVTCFDNFSTGREQNIRHLTSHPNFRLIRGDIRNFDNCRTAVMGAQVVMHQAALGSVPRSVKDPATTNEVNINGFVNMLEVSRDAGVERFIYASSSSVYGDSEALPKEEHHRGNPLSPYAVTKITNELYAQVFSLVYGMKTIGLRYFNVFGPKQDPYGPYAAVIPLFIRRLMEHKSPLINGDGSFSRDFTFIENVIRINHLAAVSDRPDASNQVFNAATGHRYDLITLFRHLREYLGAYDPAISSVEPVFGPQRKGDIPHSHASIDKAQKLLGYQPLVSFEEGLRKTVDWFWNNPE